MKYGKSKYQTAGTIPGPVQPQASYDPFGVGDMAFFSKEASPCPEGMVYSNELKKCVPRSKGQVFQAPGTFYYPPEPKNPQGIDMKVPGLWDDGSTFKPVPTNPDRVNPPDISGQTGYVPTHDGGALNNTPLSEQGRKPDPYPRYGGYGNTMETILGAANVAALHFANVRQRQRQDQYYQNNVANPYSGILPYANGLSEDTKYGTVNYKEGGLVKKQEGGTFNAYDFLFGDDEATPIQEKGPDPYASLHEAGMPDVNDYKDETSFQEDLDKWQQEYINREESPTDEGNSASVALLNDIISRRRRNLDDSIADRESGGDYSALPIQGGELASSAVGKYQFLWNQHKNWIQNVTGVSSKEEFRSNPEAQEIAFQHWKQNTLIPTAKYLLPLARRRDPNITLDDIAYKVHFLGEKGAKEFYRTGRSKIKDAFGTTAETYNKGGQVEDNNGYLESNLHNFTPTKVIDSNHITTEGMAFPITANGIPLQPNTGDYFIPGDKVVEKPMLQQGGLFATNQQAYVDSTLNANKNLVWVNRLYQPNTPSIQIPGQPGRSTHFMESSDATVYPTVVNQNGALKYLGRDARHYADSTRTGIQFPTDAQAQWFGQNYKMGTGVLRGYQIGGTARDLAASRTNSTDSKTTQLYDPKKIEEERMKRELAKMQATLSQGQDTPIYQQKINQDKLKAYAASQPNAQYNNGTLSRINQNVSMTGVPDARSAEERQAKGIEHATNALLAADGVGALTKVGYAGAKAAYSTVKNKLSGLATDIGRASREFNPSYTKKALSQVEEGNTWTKNWYDNPVTKERYDNFVARGNPYASLENARRDAPFYEYLENNPKIREGINLNKDVALRNNGIIARGNYEKLLQEGRFTQGVKQKLNPQGDWLGVYSNNADKAYVDILHSGFKKDFNIANTVVHENIHGLTNGDKALLPQAKSALTAPFKSIESNTLGANIDKAIGHDKYLIKPTEIHARIGELRKTFNLRPETRLTPNNINDIISAGLAGKTSVQPRWFELIKDKEKFRWLMNNAPVAAGAAALGAGTLESKQKGGTFEEMTGIKPITSLSNTTDSQTKTYYNPIADAQQAIKARSTDQSLVQKKKQDHADRLRAERQAVLDAASENQMNFSKGAEAVRHRFNVGDGSGGWGDVFDQYVNPLAGVAGMASDLGKAWTSGSTSDKVISTLSPIAFGAASNLRFGQANPKKEVYSLAPAEEYNNSFRYKPLPKENPHLREIVHEDFLKIPGSTINEKHALLNDKVQQIYRNTYRKASDIADGEGWKYTPEEVNSAGKQMDYFNTSKEYGLDDFNRYGVPALSDYSKGKVLYSGVIPKTFPFKAANTRYGNQWVEYAEYPNISNIKRPNGPELTMHENDYLNFGRRIADQTRQPLNQNLVRTLMKKDAGYKFNAFYKPYTTDPLEQALLPKNRDGGQINKENMKLKHGGEFAPKYQQGGATGHSQRIMQEVVQMLQSGANPEQVMQQLMQMGIPQNQAQQIIQSVMQQMQGTPAPQEMSQARMGKYYKSKNC